MIRITDLMINDPVVYNGHLCFVYGISQAQPRKHVRYNDKPIVELECNGLVTALETDIDGIPVFNLVGHFVELGWQKTTSAGITCYKFMDPDAWYSILLYEQNNEWAAQLVDPVGRKKFADHMLYIHELIHAFRLWRADAAADSFYKQGA